MIHITHHAAVRFLQRVMHKSTYTKKDLYRAYKFLEADTKDIVLKGYKHYFRLPSFSKYRAVVLENRLVTIIQKGR